MISRFFKRGLGLVFFILTIFLLPFATAHPLDLGVLVIDRQDRQLDVLLELNPAIGIKLLGLDTVAEGAALEQTLQDHSQDLFQKTLGESSATLNSKPCPWASDGVVHLDSETVLSIRAHANCVDAEGDFKLQLDFLKTLPASYNLIGKARLNGVEKVLGADPGHPTLTFKIETDHFAPLQFLEMGLEHIGLWPTEWQTLDGRWQLPFGMDHIFFVFALLLAGDSLVSLLKMITGFTVGHTLSLSLATFGVVNAPGRWIEFFVALTISLVAAESLFKFRLAKEWKICLIIGMIHGLGFAAALTGLNLNTGDLIMAILGFNFGVELGQAFLIALAFPVLLKLRQSDSGKKWILPAFSFFVFATSLYWIFNRGETLWRSF